jgi:hypothetical protein
MGVDRPGGQEGSHAAERDTPEQIIRKLRDAEAQLAEGAMSRRWSWSWTLVTPTFIGCGCSTQRRLKKSVAERAVIMSTLQFTAKIPVYDLAKTHSLGWSIEWPPSRSVG